LALIYFYTLTTSYTRLAHKEPDCESDCSGNGSGLSNPSKQAPLDRRKALGEENDLPVVLNTVEDASVKEALGLESDVSQVCLLARSFRI